MCYKVTESPTTAPTLITFIQSVDLTPINPAENGANASLITTYNSDTYIENNQWFINISNTTSSQQGFNIQINLDESWGFHPTADSYIKLTMHTPISLLHTVDVDLFLTFSVNTQQYITLYLNLDNKSPNQYYLQCITSETNNLAHGDIKSCVNWIIMLPHVSI